MNTIKNLPIEISSIVFSLGLLGSSFSTSNKNTSFFCTLLGFLLLIGLSIRIFSNLRDFYIEVDNPFKLSMFITYPLSIMILSMPLNNLNPYIGFGVWLVGFLLYLGLVIVFSLKYARKFSINNVGTSWFVAYVGFVIVSITCPIYTSKLISLSLWMGFLLAIVISPIVFKSLRKNRFMMRRHDIAVLAFPLSIILLGFSYVYQDGLYIINNILILCSQAVYLYVLFTLLRILLMKRDFDFDITSITFPLLITGISLRVQVGIWSILDQNIYPFDKIANAEIIFATLVLVYVGIKSLVRIIKNDY